MKNKKRVTTKGREAVLSAGVDLILKNGGVMLDVGKLAKQAKMTRANVYLIFSNPKKLVFEEIVEGFLEGSEETISKALSFSLPVLNSVEKLAVILRATLFHFSKNPQPGKVVLSRLDLSHGAFKRVHVVFDKVDSLVMDAMKNGEISTPFPPSIVRKILFSVLYGLLREFYLERNVKSGVMIEQCLSEATLQQGVLQVLRGFCSPPIQEKLDAQITALSVTK